jgi:hypothetical protein
MRRFENERGIFKKKRKKKGQFLKKKEKYYNYGKKRYFVREYKSFKINYAKIDNPKKKRERKI